MSNIGINTQTSANVVTPFSPVGKQAVGLEDADAKEDVFAPVEETPAKSAVFDREDSAKENADEKIKEQAEKERQQQDQQQIKQLAARDREVRAHEQAHAVVGGQYAGAPHFNYERGADGINYAVSGDVSISLPNSDDPKAALAAAEQVKMAALAPIDPSSQDRSVAAAAGQLANQALADIAVQQAQAQAAEQQARQQQRIEDEPSQQQDTEQGTRQQRLGDTQAARRSIQLNDRLVTVDSTRNESAVGSVLDQLA